MSAVKQSRLPARSTWLRASVPAVSRSVPVGVDRENNILRGFTVAQEGPFKSEGRGEFDRTSLDMILRLAAQRTGGLKSRFSHPTLSEDGIGKFLGRAKDLYLDRARDQRTGKMVQAVRGDLHFDKTALDTPPGGGKPLGIYVMDLAESDPDAISSSLVLETDEEYRLNKDGTITLGEDGEPLPPLWRPKALHASDIVDTGEAVDGILSVEGLSALPDGLVRQLSAAFDEQFRGCPREVVESRAQSWLQKYLDWKFGEKDDSFVVVSGSGTFASITPTVVSTEIKLLDPPEPIGKDMQSIKDRLELNRLTLKKYQK